MQSHECEPEAGKGVGGSCLAERMSHYDLGSRCGAAFALKSDRGAGLRGDMKTLWKIRGLEYACFELCVCWLDREHQ